MEEEAQKAITAVDAKMERLMVTLGNIKEKTKTKAINMTAAEQAVLSLLSPKDAQTKQGYLKNTVHFYHSTKCKRVL